jgi:hypothetical protein
VAEETEILGRNLLQRRFVHNRSNITETELETGPPRWEAGD